MVFRLAQRLLTEPAPRLVAKFAWTVGWHGMRSIGRFQRQAAAGTAFPPFLFFSITNNCNLSCQGCWVTPTKPPRELTPEVLDHLIDACRREGCRFFGILGGEPLLHRGLLDVIARHRDCYFQIFTNGTLLTEETVRRFRELGNVTPLISVEGLERVSDERRGGTDVFKRAMAGLDLCRRYRLITGVATSVCKSNVAELATEKFARELIRRGVHYLWYYIYRPVGANPAPELALSADEIHALREFIVDLRCRVPLAVIDAYWDDQGRALCPAAVGISHHISPGGDIEPCPALQFARDHIGDGRDLARTLRSSQFLEHFREFARTTSRGCVIMENPDLLFDFLTAEQARDSSGRNTGFAELAARRPLPGHFQPGREIPERHWLYRFAKKHWFFGFGAYG